MSDPLGKDLKLVEKDLGSDLAPDIRGDLATIDDEYNLGQALINRMRTRQGELSDLGHSLYGSQLHELIGEVNNEGTRELARIYTQEAIVQDPRVQRVLSVDVKPDPGDPNAMSIRIAIVPRGRDTALTVEFPFNLEVV